MRDTSTSLTRRPEYAFFLIGDDLPYAVCGGDTPPRYTALLRHPLFLVYSRFLTLDQALEIHAWQVRQFGGDPGILDMGKLESALAMPQQGFGGEYLHPDLAAMAAAYLYHIGRNHAFADGNKRTALHCALVFLDLNGIDLDLPVDEVEQFVLNVVTGQLTRDETAEQFRKWMGANG
jgi:death-on-curing protein